MTKSQPLLVLWLGSLFVSSVLCGQELPRSPAEVACEEMQLERLQQRFEGLGLQTSLILWRGSPAGGRYEGAFVPLGIRSFARFERQEEQVSFEIFFKTDAFLLNPNRLPLAEATLVRRDLESTLRPPSLFLPYDVSFEAALSPFNPFYPVVPVRISGAFADRSATKVGRGPVEDGLLTPCHTGTTASEAKLLRILARTLRPSRAHLTEPSNFSYKVTLWRGAEPHQYFANIYTYALGCNDDDLPGTACPYFELERIALEFRFATPVAGKLTTGSVRVLPNCAQSQLTSCTRPEPLSTMGIFVLPPLWPGQETQGPEALARGTRLTLNCFCPGNLLEANLDWAAILRDTAWNEGF